MIAVMAVITLVLAVAAVALYVAVEAVRNPDKTQRDDARRVLGMILRRPSE
ncbi:MAG: hypothetical protein JO100_10020 [Pseudonocardia sp.]|nr:hypothetical protein [Pseudonocardia sp.]